MQKKLLSPHLATLIGLLGLATTAGAVEWPVFGPVRMEALLDYNQWKRRTDQSDSDESDLQVGVSIEGSAYWMHPGIVNFFY